MIKRTIAHNEVGGINVPVNLIKADFSSLLYEENERYYILAGTLLSLKVSGENIRKKGVDVVPFTGTGQADAILLSDVEFKLKERNKVGTAMIKGVVYLDKLKEVTSTITEANLPKNVDYLNKTRI